MDFVQPSKVQLELLTMKSYLDVAGDRPKLIWDINHESNKYYEVEILPESPQKDDYELTKCYICDIDIPNTFKNQHEKSNKHFMNLKIINIALKRMANHNENSIQDTQLTSINFCAICSKFIKNTEDHESSFEHQQFLQYDLVLKLFLSVYEDKNKINDVIIEFDSNFGKNVSKRDENSNSCDKDFKEETINPLQFYFNKLNNTNIDITVLNDKTIRINTENSTLECEVNNFHGLNHIRGHVQCKVCREVITDAEEHINSDGHVTKISADIEKCCLRKIDTLYNHCILCNEIVIDIEDHLLEDEHVKLLKEKYIANIENISINRGEPHCYNDEDNIHINDKITIHHKSNSTSPELNENEDIIKRYDGLYCKVCDVYILGEYSDRIAHLNSEKHELKYAVTESNKKKTEPLAVNLNSEDNSLLKHSSRNLYEEFFETRFNTPFCNLCNTYENNLFIHKNTKKHISKYRKFLKKYDNILVKDEGYFCKTCKLTVEQNCLSNHILKYHDEDLFNEQLLALTDSHRDFKFTSNINKLWCMSCRVSVDNKKWVVVYHKNTDEHINKLATFFQDHSICKQIHYVTRKKKNYCQACDIHLKLNKIMKHIDTLSHVTNIKKISPKFDEQALLDYNILGKTPDSIEVITSDESNTTGYKDKSESSDSDNSSNGSEPRKIKKIKKRTGSINLDEAKINIGSIKHQSLPKASSDGTLDDQSYADREYKSQFPLTGDERVTDDVKGKSSASIGAWVKPLHIVKPDFNKPASSTDVDNVVVSDYCKVCSVDIPRSPFNNAEHKKGRRHIVQLEKIMFDNNLKNDNGTLSCGCCLVSVEDVIEHVSSDGHHMEMFRVNTLKDLSTTFKKLQGSFWECVDQAENCFQPTTDPRYLICEYCYLKVSPQDDLRKVHVLDEKHKHHKEETLIDNYIRRVDFKYEYHCALCLEEFKFDKVLNHINKFTHIEQYEMREQIKMYDAFFIGNNLIKYNTLEDLCYCQICYEFVPNKFPELLEHVEGEKHNINNKGK